MFLVPELVRGQRSLFGPSVSNTPGLFTGGAVGGAESSIEPGYADDILVCERPRGFGGIRRRGLSILGVRVSENQPLLRPCDFLTPLDNANQSVRVAQLRLLNKRGGRPQLNPMSTMRCGRMLNRLMGLLFQAESFELPGEVRHLFRFGKYKSIENLYLLKSFLRNCYRLIRHSGD